MVANGAEPPLAGCRVAIIGQSGAGKSTLAKALSARLGVPHIELDALNWQPGWRGLNVEEPERWSAVVAEAIAGEAWVVDGNYSVAARLHTLPRATDVVWLDYPRRVLMSRVIRRSIVRAIGGKELWPGTGNRESFARWLRWDHPIRYSWDTFARNRKVRAELFESDLIAHARKHRFRAPRETDAWLRAVT